MFVVKQLLSVIARFFAGHCPMSGANIQACRGTFLREICLDKESKRIIDNICRKFCALIIFYSEFIALQSHFFIGGVQAMNIFGRVTKICIRKTCYTSTMKIFGEIVNDLTI